MNNYNVTSMKEYNVLVWSKPLGSKEGIMYIETYYNNEPCYYSREHWWLFFFGSTRHIVIKSCLGSVSLSGKVIDIK